MECSNTSTSRLSKQSRTPAKCHRLASGGFTFVELQVSLAIGMLALLAVMALMLYTARSFAALTNYIDLDNVSRNALDVITGEIRQADTLVSGTDTSMSFQFRNPTNSVSSWVVTYSFDPNSRTLTRIQGTSRRVMLEECDFLRFAYFRRNPIGGTYDQYPTAATPLSGAAAQECKLVQLRWICSRQIMQQAVNTESVQSAKVVIRKQ
jgi:hypothetical protein